MPHLSHNGLFSKFRLSASKNEEKTAVPSFTILLSLATLASFNGQYSAIAADKERVSSETANTIKYNATKSKPEPGKHSKGLIANVQAAEKGEQPPVSTDAESKNLAKSDETSDDNIYAQKYFADERQSRKRKYAHSSSTVLIYAPQSVVWKVLIDFERYPEIFKRIESCHITKREHGLLFAESYLKPQMFVKKLCQHTVTDISQGPRFLHWKMLDGNFTAVLGSWTLSTTTDKKNKPVCSATYTLEADPGPVIPGPMVSFLLHQIEHEVVTSFKKACETTAQN